MLLIKTYLAPSKIHGVGLFAGENIKKTQVTWKYNANFDKSFTVQEVNKMPNLLKKFVREYASLSTQTKKYILCNDNARFTNHSTNANLEAIKMKGEIELIARAKKDIKKGEELTINYRTIDNIDAKSKKGYLNS